MAHSIAAAAKHNRDELYTPRYLIDAAFPYFKYTLTILKNHLQRDLIILCPFDTAESEFVKKFTEEKYEVKYGHIETGQDFFTYDYGLWDVCISNPPFSHKLKVFQKLHLTNKPWAMICNAMCLNYMEIIHYFINYPVQMMFFDKRVSYNGNPSSFGSMFICDSMLPIDLTFVSLPHCNQGKDFKPSGMYKFG